MFQFMGDTLSFSMELVMPPNAAVTTTQPHSPKVCHVITELLQFAFLLSGKSNVCEHRKES